MNEITCKFPINFRDYGHFILAKISNSLINIPLSKHNLFEFAASKAPYTTNQHENPKLLKQNVHRLFRKFCKTNGNNLVCKPAFYSKG